MVPSAVSPSKRREFQVNDDPPLVLTPEKSTPPPLARKPVESAYKRRKLLNSKKGNNNICGGGDVEDLQHPNPQPKLRNCDFIPSKGHDCMQQQQQGPSQEQIGKAALDGIPNYDPFRKVNLEGCTLGEQFTRGACSVGNDSKYRKSKTQPKKRNYYPKINDRTKPKKIPVPKSEKKVKPRKNTHESRMPRTGQVAEESIPGPLTPEPLDKERLTNEPLDKKRINQVGRPREDCAILAPYVSWKTRPARTPCRRALDFSNNVEDENASIQVSTGSVTNFSDVNEAGSVANFSHVNEANELMWWSSINNLEVEDFGSCIEMREIIREHKGTNHSSKKTPANIKDLKGAWSKIFRGYPKRKRSRKSYHPKMHKAVLTDTVAVTSLDTTCIQCDENYCRRIQYIETNNNQPEAGNVSNVVSEVPTSSYAAYVQVENNRATLACSSHDSNQMLYEHDVQYGHGFSQYSSAGLESSQCYGETISGMHTRPLQQENLVSEDEAFNTMEQDCWAETPILEDSVNPCHNLCNAYVRTFDSAQMQGFDVHGRIENSPLNPYVRTLNTAQMEGVQERLEQNSLIPYMGTHNTTQMQGFDVPGRLENSALIPHGGCADLAQTQELALQEREADRALVPHKEQKKRTPKASVHLCPNTIKVWNLLMESDAGLEGIDEPTKEWMKDETKQLSDRIEVFISRMKLFQGDRRFSRWGGSVLDSVVGVLLTQNVTDVLSSSAFMNLAAKYPSKLRRTQKKYGESSRNEKAVNSHQPQDSPQYTDMEDLSCRESVSESSSCSGHPGRFSLDLNLPPHPDSSYVKLLLGVSSPPDCKSSPSTSSELKNLQSCVQGLEPNKDTDEVSQNGGASESWKTNPDDYWYSIGREIATAKAKMRGKTSKIASRNNEVTSELKDPSRKSKEKQTEMPDKRVNWDELKTRYCTCKPRNYDNLDAVDWEAVQRAPFEEVSKVIEERGMNNLIAGRIKDILDRLLRDHGSLDLEWLRDVPPIKAKDYLRSIGGIGLKSVECIRLLELEHHAFAVDTNIGRIAVRLGWVPLKPLPDGILIHLLDKYPLVDKIQQYLWPRLQGLHQRILYELHYHMITFGKIFCKKRRPNCNACPMKGECRHFASEYASEKLKLPSPNNEASECGEGHTRPATKTPTQLLLEGSLPELRYECACEPYVELPSSPEPSQLICEGSQLEPRYASACEAFVEHPSSPEPACVEPIDIEDLSSAKDDEIPVIELNTEAFRQNLLMEMERRNCLQLDIILNELASATHESASIPMKKMKGLRTEHYVYELEDGHPSLEGFAQREHDDPCPYLVKIWTPDEKLRLGSKIEEEGDQTVLGTILIPCKTANGGCFPLNATYFQKNEVFADDKTSRKPIAISTKDLWNRPRRLVYCGTSVTSIFTGCDLQTITNCFWRGFVCTRGYNRDTRGIRPMARVLHKTSKNKKDLDE